MPSPKQLAKALARQDSVTKQPRNRFLGAVADAAGYVSDQADRYVVPERDPLFGGMRGGDLLPLRNVNRLLDDLSYGGRITTGRGQTTTLRPEVVDTVGLGGAMMPAAKSLGKAALRNVAEQVQNKTGILGRNVIDPRQQIITYHGSPHTFPPTANNPLGEFDPIKVGTGEGAQAYGVGAGYLAEAKGIGKRYQEALSNYEQPFLQYGKKKIAGQDLSNVDLDALKYLEIGKRDAGQFPHNTVYYAKQAAKDRPEVLGRLDELGRDVKFGYEVNKGNLYKVDLPDEHVAKMLDWDKPLSEQHPDVQAAVQQWGDNFNPTDTGEHIYRKFSSGAASGHNVQQASRDLQQLGITGIRYLDAASRDAVGKGTSNFVVFDPKHMNILERNGVGGAMMQRPKTEFEILHDTAQRNAALPVEQGGLGLPEGNTGMDRANAMDWNTPAYHGSGEELRVINNEKLKRNAYGKGLHSASDPELANIFANHSSEGQNVSPLLLRLGNQASKQDYKNAMNQVWDEGGHDATKIRQLLVDKGFDTVTYNHGDFYYPQDAGLVKSLPNQDLSYATLNPSQVRSRFAAFDPMRRHEADILAGVGVGGMLDPQAIAEALRQQDRK